ncbi:dUTP diphosphatase [Candidatus Uhrbacteria bacterium]|nr:dUTP diphosphatase [Candidatus Uhrbacteria bacterium]
MMVRIHRIDPTLPLPAYHTPGSVAFDLYSRIDTTVAPKAIERIPTNIIVETPEKYMLVVVPRSSTPKRKGLSIPQGIGVVDQDYCGPNDEILLQFYNFTDHPVTIEKGERLGQAVFVRIDKAEFSEEEIDAADRGGYGSTGTTV